MPDPAVVPFASWAEKRAVALPGTAALKPRRVSDSSIISKPTAPSPLVTSARTKPSNTGVVRIEELVERRLSHSSRRYRPGGIRGNRLTGRPVQCEPKRDSGRVGIRHAQQRPRRQRAAIRVDDRLTLVDAGEVKQLSLPQDRS